MKKTACKGFLPVLAVLAGLLGVAVAVLAIEPLPAVRSITVTAPVAGAQFQVGQVVAIRWTGKGAVGNSVRVRLVPEIEPAAAQVVIASTANDGSCSWMAAATFPGRVWIEVQTLDGQVTGRSGTFTVSPAGGGSESDSRTYPVNQVYHNTYAGEQFTPIKELAGYIIRPGTRMTVRLSLGAAPPGFGFATRAHFPGSGCAASEVRINGNCYPFSPGADPAVREQTFSSQWIAENGQVCQLKLYVYGTMPPGDYQLSGSVQVTLAR